MEIKDFFPLIGTLITAVCGYYLISAQVSKNRKAKWIDDFRENIATLNASALGYLYQNKKTEEQLYLIRKSVSMVKLYIDLNDPFQKILFDVIKEFTEALKTNDEKAFKESLDSMGNIAYIIIKNEQNSLFSTRVAIKGKEYIVTPTEE